MKDLVDAARAAGLTVLLDGRIGREEYHSVAGSMAALQRFADAYANEAIELGSTAERLRNRAALQIDDSDAHLMRAAARVIARMHYEQFAKAAAEPAASTEPCGTSR